MISLEAKIKRLTRLVDAGKISEADYFMWLQTYLKGVKHV